MLKSCLSQFGSGTLWSELGKATGAEVLATFDGGTGQGGSGVGGSGLGGSGLGGSGDGGSGDVGSPAGRSVT